MVNTLTAIQLRWGKTLRSNVLAEVTRALDGFWFRWVRSIGG